MSPSAGSALVSIFTLVYYKLLVLGDDALAGLGMYKAGPRLHCTLGTRRNEGYQE